MSIKQKRIQALCPSGIPKYIRCYNGNKTIDTYTVVFTGNYTKKTLGEYLVVHMSARPFHPQGVGQHASHKTVPDSINGRWGGPKMGSEGIFGKRIPFIDLPDDCKKLVLDDYNHLWDLLE